MHCPASRCVCQRGPRGLPTAGGANEPRVLLVRSRPFDAVAGPRRHRRHASCFFDNPVNPLSHTPYGRTVAAACELFERTTRRYGKPTFGLADHVVDGERVTVDGAGGLGASLLPRHRLRSGARGRRRPQPKLLIVAPMSGHYATLLRGTVEAFLPTHQVCITDWVDARMVPLAAGRFDLDDYIDYLIVDVPGARARTCT